MDWPTGKQAPLYLLPPLHFSSELSPTCSQLPKLSQRELSPHRNAGRTRWRLLFVRNVPPKRVVFFFPPQNIQRKGTILPSGLCTLLCGQQGGTGWRMDRDFSSILEQPGRTGNEGRESWLPPTSGKGAWRWRRRWRRTTAWTRVSSSNFIFILFLEASMNTELCGKELWSSRIFRMLSIRCYVFVWLFKNTHSKDMH